MGGQIVVEFKKVFPNFSVEADFEFSGGFNVILGPSGCGKTTTLRVMCGLEKADEGFMKCCEEIFFDTERKVFLPPQRRRLGIVFQEDNLLPHLSVRENIEFSVRKAWRSKIDVGELIEKFGLRGMEDKKPSEISGGQRQKVAIIRALAYNPRALLMDEPFSSLDFRRKLKIIEFLKELELDIPIVIVTHDPLEAILLADKVFLMEGGRKVAEGGKELVEEYFSGIGNLLGNYSPS
jgi:molybdate transport system ATP-binding protein